jgi:hypothetical protein
MASHPRRQHCRPKGTEVSRTVPAEGDRRERGDQAPPEFKEATRRLWEVCQSFDNQNHASDAVINWALKQFLPSSRWYAGIIAYCLETGEENDTVIVARVDAALLFDLIGGEPNA